MANVPFLCPVKSGGAEMEDQPEVGKNDGIK